MKKLVILLLTAAASFVGAANLTLQDVIAVSVGDHPIGDGCPVVAYTNEGQDILVAWQDTNGSICGSWGMSGTWTTPTTILSGPIQNVYPISVAGNDSGIVLTYVDSDSTPMSIFYNAASKMWTTPQMIISTWRVSQDSVSTPVLVIGDSSKFYVTFAYQHPPGVGVIGYTASSTGSGSWSGGQLFSQGAYSPTSISGFLPNAVAVGGAVWASNGIGYLVFFTDNKVSGRIPLDACKPSSEFSLGINPYDIRSILYGDSGSLKQINWINNEIITIGSLGNINKFVPQVAGNKGLKGSVTSWIDNNGNVQAAVGYPTNNLLSVPWSGPTQLSNLNSSVGNRPLTYFGVTSAIYNSQCIFAWASQMEQIYVSQGSISSTTASTGAPQGLTGSTVFNQPTTTGSQRPG
ncbi:MAG: hypothetical protein WCG10_03235 [Chlamydiota bacterium]